MRNPSQAKRASTKATAKAARTPIKADPPSSMVTPSRGKIGLLVSLLRQSDGATIDAMMNATGWQAHSVRGAISGSVKKTLGLNVLSEKTDAGRVYRIIAGTAA